MNFEKIRWWHKTKKVIRNSVWYYPKLVSAVILEQKVVPIYDKRAMTVTCTQTKRKMSYEQYCGSYQTNGECFDSAYEKTLNTLNKCKNLGAVVTTLTFDQFHSFWSINPYRWHCRDLFAYTQDEENKKMFIQFKTKTDLRIYIGWREEIREAQEKQTLIEERSASTIALLKEVQRDINDTNGKAIEYYEQAVEYLGDDYDE